MTELGPLPEDWRVVRLGDVFEIQQGKALSRKKDKGIRPRPFLRTANVLWGKLDLTTLDQMDFSPEEEERYTLTEGDLLVCEGGEIGRTAMWEGQLTKVYYQNHLHRLRRKTSRADPRFYMYWLQASFTLLGLYGGVGNKTTIPNLSRSRLAAFRIPLPPLPEQRAIAHVLRTVQAAREATEGVITALRELKKSLMRHLFTYGPVPLDAVDRVEMQETEIGPIPGHWRVARFGQVATLQRGKDLPKRHRRSGRVPVVGSNGVAGFHSKAIARAPGVCVGRSGSVGKVTRIIEDYWPLNTVLWVKDFHGNDPLFVYYFLSRFDFSPYVSGVSVPTLNRNLVHPLRVAVPPLSEQREIARILQAVDRKIDAEDARRQALEDLFRSLLHHLMTAKVRLPGEFVGQFGKTARDPAQS